MLDEIANVKENHNRQAIRPSWGPFRLRLWLISRCGEKAQGGESLGGGNRLGACRSGGRMSAEGQKRKQRRVSNASAPPQTADITQRGRHVRLADIDLGQPDPIFGGVAWKEF